MERLTAMYAITIPITAAMTADRKASLSVFQVAPKIILLWITPGSPPAMSKLDLPIQKCDVRFSNP